MLGRIQDLALFSQLPAEFTGCAVIEQAGRFCHGRGFAGGVEGNGDRAARAIGFFDIRAQPQRIAFELADAREVARTAARADANARCDHTFHVVKHQRAHGKFTTAAPFIVALNHCRNDACRRARLRDD